MKTRFLSRAAVAAGVVLAMSFPVGFAMAAPAAPSGQAGPGMRARANGQVRTDRLTVVKDRIEAALIRRKVRFDAAKLQLDRHLVRLERVAGKLDAKGADTAKARSDIAAARTDLGTASTIEAAAGELFRAVPGATDKKSAFAAARAKAREAVTALRSARSHAREAAADLRAVVQSLKSQPATGTAQ